MSWMLALTPSTGAPRSSASWIACASGLGGGVGPGRGRRRARSPTRRWRHERAQQQQAREGETAEDVHGSASTSLGCLDDSRVARPRFRASLNGSEGVIGAPERRRSTPSAAPTDIFSRRMVIVVRRIFWFLARPRRVLRGDARRPARRAGVAAHANRRPASALSRSGSWSLFAFGLVVPALVLAFNGEHKASVAVGGVHLNADEQKGRELFAHACTVCHTLAAVKSVGRIGPNLDIRVGDDIATRRGARRCAERDPRRPRPRPRPHAGAALPGQGSRRRRDFVAAVAGH